MNIIHIADISIKDSPRVRHAINEDVVDDYAESYKSKQKMPPVILYEDKKLKTYYVADGLHRIYACQKLKMKGVVADVRQGGYDDALLHALTCNLTHGLRRTNADKREAVHTTIKRWPERSDKWIAETCNVSNMLVAQVRKEMEQADEVKPATTRTGTDGKARKIAKPKDEDEEGEDEDIIHESSPRPAKEKIDRDSTGYPMPKSALEMWQRNHEVNAVLSEVSKLKTWCESGQKDMLWAEVPMSLVIADLEKVWQNLNTGKSYAVCPTCQGRPEVQPNKTCTLCKGKAFISKFRYEHCVPSQIRSIREKGIK